MAPWNRRFLLETIIFRFHVKFSGGIGCQLFYQLTGPMVPTDCAVPRCQEMTAQAFLKVDNESQKQFENRCNFCCTGTLGMIFGSEGELREGFVALFFSKEIATMQTLMVLKIFFGS